MVTLNLVLSVVFTLLVLFLCVRRGFRKGFAYEVSAMFSLVLGAVVISLLASLVKSLRNGNTGSVVIGIVLLALFGLVYRILHILLNSINFIARLPVISWLDSFLGIVSGLISGFCILYVIEFLLRDYILI